MAVFYDTGGGDIYAGPTREAVIAEMKKDLGEDDFDEGEVIEIPGTKRIRWQDENEEPSTEMMSLDEAYTEGLGTYCIASENC